MKISDKKRSKISEQVIGLLYSISPKQVFTSHLAQEIARDEEFVKKILLELNQKGLVTEIKKNPKGQPYQRRSRWKISDAAYDAYRKAEETPNTPLNTLQEEIEEPDNKPFI